MVIHIVFKFVSFVIQNEFPSPSSPKIRGDGKHKFQLLHIMIRKGTKVSWKWGNGSAEGTVEETYTSKITKTIKGTEVTRNGSSGDKALYISQEDGNHVLKSESEVDRVD